MFHDHAGNMIDDGTFRYVYDAWNRLVTVKSSTDSGAVTFQTAEFDARGRRIKKVVDNSGDFDGTVVYLFDGHKIIETRDGSDNVVQQFIHGTRYIGNGLWPDELVMMRAIDKGDLYIHQGERRERERAAIGIASRDARDRPATCPEEASTKRAAGGANWNVIALTDLGGSVVERYTYTPYGELTVHQETNYGDRDGDDDVDSTDRAAAEGGGACRGSSPTGACRILDHDFDNDVDDDDLTLFDALDAGLSRHPARTSTGVHQPFAHQGLLYEPELGSYQNRLRQYDPAKRRFVQRDRMGYEDGLGLYAYVQVNPLRGRDPFGLQCNACCDSNSQGCPMREPSDDTGYCNEGTNIFHPQAERCYRGIGSNRGQQCCYTGGCLICDGQPGAGTWDVFPPFSGRDLKGNCTKNLWDIFIVWPGHLVVDIIIVPIIKCVVCDDDDDVDDDTPPTPEYCRTCMDRCQLSSEYPYVTVWECMSIYCPECL